MSKLWLCDAFQFQMQGVFDEPLGVAALRQDLVFYPVPFDKVVAPLTGDARLRKLLKNMAYVGVLARANTALRDSIDAILRARMLPASLRPNATRV